MQKKFTVLLADYAGPVPNIRMLHENDAIHVLHTDTACDALVLGESNTDIDLVLVSVVLDGMTNFDTVRELVHQRSERPVILLSKYVNLSIIKLAGMLGCKDVLKTPVDSNSLEKLLEHYSELLTA